MAYVLSAAGPKWLMESGIEVFLSKMESLMSISTLGKSHFQAWKSLHNTWKDDFCTWKSDFCGRKNDFCYVGK